MMNDRQDKFACPFYYNKIELDDEQCQNAIANTPYFGAMSVDNSVLNTQFSFLYDPIHEITKEVMNNFGYYKFCIFSSWMTYTESNYRHGYDHSHTNSFYSGVLYITENPSPILFRHPMPWRWHDGNRSVNDGVSPGSNQYIFEPNKGDIVLFPSFVHHVILPHKSRKPRCSIAFNVVPTGTYGMNDSNITVTVSGGGGGAL